MPPWRVHNIVAQALGYPVEASEKINRLVDSGPIHDIGRIFPSVKFFDALNCTDKYLQNCSKIKSVFSQIQGEEKEDLFYLHHALDSFLTWRIASALLSDADFLEVGQELSKGCENDLKELESKVREKASKCGIRKYPLLHDLPKRLESEFENIVRIQEYMDWIRSSVIEKRRELQRENPETLFSKIAEDWCNKARSYLKGRIKKDPYYGFSPEDKIKVLIADAKMYFRGGVNREINNLSLLRSGMYDFIVARMKPSWPLSFVRDTFVNTSGRLWSSMNFRIQSKKEMDIQDLRSAAQSILQQFSGGVKVPENLINGYVNEVVQFVVLAKKYPCDFEFANSLIKN